MPIVFSAITPHPPILLPQIGKDNLKQLKKTKKSFLKLKKKIEDINPDTIIVISPHGPLNVNCFNMNLSPEFSANFEEFGDFSTKKNWIGDVGLMHQVRESLETTDWLQLVSEENLDHGTSLPLLLLTENLPNVKIVPLYYSGLTLQKHFEFGNILRKKLHIKKRKIAIIASGDMSHCLSREAPGGFSPKGKKFDNRLLELIQKKSTEEILSLDPNLIDDACECGLKSFVILLGILDKINHKPKLLSYEYPFGVGYMVMDFEI